MYSWDTWYCQPNFSILSNMQLGVVFLKLFTLGSTLGHVLYLPYFDLSNNISCNIAVYADNAPLYSKCNWAPDLWQQIELACVFESELQITVD